MFIYYRIKNLVSKLLFSVFIAPFFKKFGSKSAILNPFGIEGINNISVGNSVYISDGVLLAAVPHTGAADCLLQICDGTSIGRNNHIYACNRIVIEENVLTANNVYISDNSHEYRDIEKPIKCQKVNQLSTVTIGRGSWLGQNVCVIGANIGVGCVVGANSVVLEDIPDFSVAVGVPARIVKIYNKDNCKWENVKS